MEDEHLIIEKFANTEDMCYFAVYDGHGGIKAAEYVKENLHKNIIQQIGNDVQNADIKKCVVQGFIDTDANLVSNKEKSGSTAAVAIIRKSSSGKTLYTANVGDARIVLNRNGIGVAVTKDHKSSDPDEAKLITNRGGLMVGGKVGASLAVSRAFGDSEFKNWISVDPYQEEIQLTDTDTHLIVACDGLWDVCSNQQAVDLIKSETNPQNMSDILLNYALKNHTRDNLTIIVVLLQ